MYSVIVLFYFFQSHHLSWYASFVFGALALKLLTSFNKTTCKLINYLSFIYKIIKILKKQINLTY